MTDDTTTSFQLDEDDDDHQLLLSVLSAASEIEDGINTGISVEELEERTDRLAELATAWKVQLHRTSRHADAGWQLLDEVLASAAQLDILFNHSVFKPSQLREQTAQLATLAAAWRVQLERNFENRETDE